MPDYGAGRSCFALEIIKWRETPNRTLTLGRFEKVASEEAKKRGSAGDKKSGEVRHMQAEEKRIACTVGVLMGKRKDGRTFVADVISVRENGADVRRLIKNTASSDNALYGKVTIPITARLLTSRKRSDTELR